MVNKQKPVVLVVDTQVGVLKSAYKPERVIQNILVLIENARAAEVPIIWVQHASEDLVPNSAEWQFVPELVPAAEDLIIAKQYNSAFEATSLIDDLKQRDVTHIVLAGAATNWCIRATAYGALDRGYDLTLVRDAHTTDDMDMGDGTMILARDVIRELNVGIKWVSYPSKSNAEKASDVHF